MEALPSLASGFCFSSIPKMACGPSIIYHPWVVVVTFHVSVVEPYFPNMAWLDIKGIVKLIKFSFEMAF